MKIYVLTYISGKTIYDWHMPLIGMTTEKVLNSGAQRSRYSS